MDDEKRARLNELLETLGHTINRAVSDSDEVNHVLAELHSHGWDAVMFLSASMLCRQDAGGDEVNEGVRIQVGTADREVAYRLDAADARWLSAIGISPTRHRSHPQRALPPFNQSLLPPARSDG